MFKKIIFILALLFLLIACKDSKENKKIQVIIPNGVPLISISKLYREKPIFKNDINPNYTFINSSELLVAKLVSEEADISIIPSNLALKLYNKGLGYKFVAPSIWGVLYIVSDEDINSWSELKGKKIFLIGRGLTPDILTRKLLQINGIDPDKDVDLVYVNSSVELAQFFIAEKSSVSLMAEPMLSKVLFEKKSTKVIFDLQKEWEKISTSKKSYPQAGLIIKNDLIKNNPEFVKEFIEKYKESTDWVNQNPKLAAKYCTEINSALNSNFLSKAIKGCNIKFSDKDSSYQELENYFEVLYNFSPKTIGGKLPDDNFYYKK